MSKNKEADLLKMFPTEINNPYRREALLRRGFFLGTGVLLAASSIIAVRDGFFSATNIFNWLSIMAPTLSLAGQLLPLLNFQEKYEGQSNKLKIELRAAIQTHHPEWKQTLPTKTEFDDFWKAFRYLPPIGGKVDKAGKSEPLAGQLIPTRTAETSTNAVINHLKQYQYRPGQKLIYQVSVQGRLPDRFKYAALTLAITNPAELDWDNPYFKAPWGKMAPLIHDGGRVDKNVNPLWKMVDGRTDFLFQLTAFEPNLDSLEQLSIGQVAKLTQEQLTAALRERKLREYLPFAARFYQRIACACHAASGSLPETVPPNLRKSLTDHWYFFEDNLKDLLDSCDLLEVTQPAWFLDQPRDLIGWHGPRYEANWPPIREKLKRIEQVRMETPEICYQAARLMRVVTNRIDQEIGILTSSERL